MAFYPAKGGSGELKLLSTNAITMQIPANGDTVIDVREYDKDAKLAVGCTISVPAVSGRTWGGVGTYSDDHGTCDAQGGQSGKVTFDGPKIHILQIPTAGTANVTAKISCTVFLMYVK